MTLDKGVVIGSNSSQHLLDIFQMLHCHEAIASRYKNKIQILYQVTLVRFEPFRENYNLYIKYGV